jgi:hypothetical protein
VFSHSKLSYFALRRSSLAQAEHSFVGSTFFQAIAFYRHRTDAHARRGKVGLPATDEIVSPPAPGCKASTTILTGVSLSFLEKWVDT